MTDMTPEAASLKIASAYAALVRAEERHPNSAALLVLHARLNELLELYIADHPGVVRPYDGDPKPPS